MKSCTAKRRLLLIFIVGVLTVFLTIDNTISAGGGGINKYECIECNITDLADALKNIHEFVKKIYLMSNKITAVPTDVFRN